MARSKREKIEDEDKNDTENHSNTLFMVFGLINQIMDLNSLHLHSLKPH